MLQRLKEYKEVIAVAVFFLGGLAWIESQYPKRTDLAVLECLLREYMTLTQQQMRANDLERESEELTKSLAEQTRLASVEPLSPALQFEFDRKRDQLAELHQDLKRIEEDMRQTSERLQRHSCGRVSG